ncbi:MAG: hydroxyacid oxidase 1-like [Gammaproteobacteria bacterium]|nr:hydroxyacid oxidase 1-like [Gammaproteobacteria bacterium]
MHKKLLNIRDFETAAKKSLPKPIFDFFYGGALDEITLKRNEQAYSNLMLLPRALRNASHCNTHKKLLGFELSMPVIAAPMGLQYLAHPSGEIGLSKAVAEAGLANILSTMSSESLEIVAEKTNCPSWLQLYIFKDRALTLDLIQRAESHGYLGIVLTIDTPLMAKREQDIRNEFCLPLHIYPKNFNLFTKTLSAKDQTSTLRTFAATQFDRSLTWRDIDWLKSATKLPIVLKGISHPEDAMLAVEANVEAIIVSNHGGRQLDGMPASIELLPEVVSVVKQRIPILVDGGIRRGADILKALILGADAVLIGRPLLWGLATDGQQGVSQILRILQEELVEAMALTGINNLSKIEHPGKMLYSPNLRN